MQRRTTILNVVDIQSPPLLCQVTEVTAMPADRSAEALSLAVALESSGLVHFAVRRAADGLSSVASRDHTIVYRGTREVNGTSSSSSVPQQQLPRGDATANAGVAAGGVFETVEGLEPNATYEVRCREVGWPSLTDNTCNVLLETSHRMSPI